MTVSVDDIKKKINNVRAQFNQQQGKMRDRVGKSGAGGDDDQFDPLPWWYNSLLFLAEHIKVRKGKSSLDDSFVNATVYVQDAEVEDEVLSDGLLVSTSSLENSTQRQFNDPIVRENKSKKRKLDESNIDDNINSTVKTLAALQKSLDETQNNDEFTQFGIFIANELRKFDDEEILDDTKLDIHNIIHSAKKKILARKRAGIIIDVDV